MGIRGHIHVEVVTEEVAFLMGIPSPVAVRLGIMASAVTGAEAFFHAAAEALLALLSGCADGVTVTGKRKMGRGNQPTFYGFNKELLAVQLKNQPKGVLGF